MWNQREFPVTFFDSWHRRFETVWPRHRGSHWVFSRAGSVGDPKANRGYHVRFDGKCDGRWPFSCGIDRVRLDEGEINPFPLPCR